MTLSGSADKMAVVLTWTLLDSRGLVQYEPVALASTVVPTRRRHLMRQRARWARGMIEGIRINPPHRQPRVLAKFVAGVDPWGRSSTSATSSSGYRA